jgi:hypothetical protein
MDSGDPSKKTCERISLLLFSLSLSHTLQALKFNRKRKLEKSLGTLTTGWCILAQKIFGEKKKYD